MRSKAIIKIILICFIVNLKIYSAGFFQNKGQLPQSEIKYYLNMGNLSIDFLQNKIIFSVINGGNEVSTMEITFPGSRVSEPTGLHQSKSKSNFFINGFSITDVSQYQEIVYFDLYPNIDLHYYLSNHNLKYDFIVKPGGNSDNIRIYSNKFLQIDNSGTKISYLTVNQLNPFILSWVIKIMNIKLMLIQ